MHVHLDMLGGLAGDMFLAGALDAGLCEPRPIERALSSLGLGDITVQSERRRRGAIEGTHVQFAGWDEEADENHRHLSTIEEILRGSDLEAEVRTRAIQMFRRLGEAESEIHGIPLEDVHFHECGALDSIFDFVSAAWILEHAAESWSWGPIPLGSGTVETDHGTVPVPVPASARLLEGFSTVTRTVEAELVTPTGATILSTLRESFGELSRPPGRIAADGYGAGTRDPEALSNVVRFLAIEPAQDRREESGEETDEVVRLVAEIDDMQPELMARACEVLRDAGALDVVREPVQMKKGRQGTRLSVLARPEDRDKLVDTIFEQTSTFGLRLQRQRREKLARKRTSVETAYGEVVVKIGSRDGEIVQVSPEFDSCRERAARCGVTAETVYRAALSAVEAPASDSAN